MICHVRLPILPAPSFLPHASGPSFRPGAASSLPVIPPGGSDPLVSFRPERRTAPVEMTGEERRGIVMIRHGRLQPDARHAFRRGLERSCRPVPPYCRRAAPTNEQMFIYCSYCECQALLCAAPVPTVRGITRRPRAPAVTRTPALRRRALPAGKAGFSAGPLHREFPAPTSPSAPCASLPASVARAARRRDRARRCRSRASGRRLCARGPGRWC